MTKITVSGLPPNITCSAISLCFSKMLSKIGVGKFWVREISYVRNAKQASIEFVSYYEASKSKNKLDKFIFDFNGQQFRLNACIEETHLNQLLRNQRRPFLSSCGETYRSYKRNSTTRYDERNHTRRHAEKTLSPLRNIKETSKLDMEIEMLRKQRLAIEEERRLLIKSKKLELVREYGHNAAKELAYIDQRGQESYGTYRFKTQAENQQYRPMPSYWNIQPHTSMNKPTYRPLSRLPLYTKNGYTTPLFVLPCKKLLKAMMERLSFGNNTNEIKLVLRQVRTILRKRIAVALEGKPRMTSEDIVKLYRRLYPERTDEYMVKRFLKRLREGSAEKEMKVGEMMEGALADSKNTTPEVSTDTDQENTDENEDESNKDDSDDELKDEKDDLTIDCGLSLDTIENESLEDGRKKWRKGRDWWTEDANQTFIE